MDLSLQFLVALLDLIHHFFVFLGLLLQLLVLLFLCVGYCCGQVLDISLKFLTLFFQFRYLVVLCQTSTYHLLLAFIRVYHSPHCMIYRALIEVFVGLCLVSVLISNPYQQQAPLPTVYCYLPNDLVKALIEQLFPHRTETDLPRLPPNQSSIELLVELDDFYLGGGSGEDSLDPELSVVCAMLLGREDLSQDIFGVMQFFILLGLLVVMSFPCSTEEDRGGILDERVLLCLH